MSKFRRVLLAAAVLAGATAAAQAADLNGGSMKDSYMPPIAYGPSWYIRGDIAWAHYDKPEMWEDGIWKLSQTNIDRNFVFGGGVGHYFTRNVRGDITFEHRRDTEFSGTLADPGSPIPGERRFNVQTNAILANLYYDFNSGGRVMPYIGVGLGAAHHKVSAGVVDPICGCPGIIEGAKNWSVAGALMTGVSINILGGSQHGGFVRGGMKDEPVAVAPSRALYLDVGYRFSQDPKVDSVHAHEFRLGLRYDLR